VKYSNGVKELLSTEFSQYKSAVCELLNNKRGFELWSALVQ